MPIVVAVNKIDKPGADPERVKRQLAELGLSPEEWGGDTLFVARLGAHAARASTTCSRQVALQAEVLELKANPNKPATGVVIEAELDRGRGPVATHPDQRRHAEPRRRDPGRRRAAARCARCTTRIGNQLDERRAVHAGRRHRLDRRARARATRCTPSRTRRRRRRSPTAARPRSSAAWLLSTGARAMTLEDLAKAHRRDRSARAEADHQGGRAGLGRGRRPTP